MNLRSKEAYLMLSYFQKCIQVVIGFGILVAKAIKKYQFTYGSERIVGWVLQNGDIRSDRAKKLGDLIRFVDVKSLKDVPCVAQALKDGEKMPTGAEKGLQLGRNSDHVWITFVIESGRIYDMDLCAFQFGILSPFLHIMPVLSADPTAFNGVFDRDRISGVNMPDFEESIDGLARNLVTRVNSMPGASGNLQIDLFLKHFNDIYD